MDHMIKLFIDISSLVAFTPRARHPRIVQYLGYVYLDGPDKSFSIGQSDMIITMERSIPLIEIKRIESGMIYLEARLTHAPNICK